MDLPIRPNVLAMEPYSPGKPIEEVKRELGLERVIKLASNENPLGPSPKAVAAVRAAAERMHIYPDGSAHAFRAAAAAHFGVQPNQILVGNGSDELIHLLGLLFLGSPGDELMMGDPGFSRYDASAHLAPARLVKVPLDADLVHDLPAMLAAVGPQTKLVFIANPNNPTGTVVSRAAFEAFMAGIPPQSVVILDEAYFEYAEGADTPSGLDYIGRYENLVVLRTLSKVYGLAGIRIGFGFASPKIVDAVNRAREPFDVNALAQAAGIAALEDREHVARSVAWNTEGIRRLEESFRAVGAMPYRSRANFVLADLGQPAQPVFQELLKHGVITRAGAAIGLPRALRVTVGTEEELEIFDRALKAVMVQEAVAR
jgi:histidinol-phosphate aminotransferase